MIYKYDMSGRCDLFVHVCICVLEFVYVHAYACMFVYVLITCVCVCVGGFRVKEAFYQQAPAAVAALST